MADKCLYCGKKRKINARLRCRECQEKANQDTVKGAYTALFHGTGEEEDEYVVKMWDVLDGNPGKRAK